MQKWEYKELHYRQVGFGGRWEDTDNDKPSREERLNELVVC
jgi:hypothetical protein